MKTVYLRALSVFLLVITTGASVSAEELHELQPGTRVRATYLAEQVQGKTRSRQITGNIEELTDCTLGVSKSSTTRVLYIPRESITRLERSIRPDGRGKAMNGGFIAGIGVGALFAIPVLLHNPEPGEWDLRGLALVFAGLSIVVGTTIGWIIGLTLAHGEKWQDVDLSTVTFSFESDSGHDGRLLLGFRF